MNKTYRDLEVYEQKAAAELKAAIDSIEVGEGLNELASFINPPQPCIDVARAILIVFNIDTKNPWHEFQNLVKTRNRKHFIDTISKGPFECPPGTLQKLALIINKRTFAFDYLTRVSAIAS